MFSWNDISNWQKGWRVSGPIVAKAGEGLAFTDGQYAGFCAQALAGGWPCFAYYALHTAQPVDQARRAVGIIGQRPAMFDVEQWPQESGSPAGIATLAELLSAVDAYRSFGGVMNVCYLPAESWRQMGRPDLTPLTARGIEILNADYRYGDTFGTPAWAPYGGITPWGLQYKAENNTFPGDQAQWMAAWTGTGGAHQPAPGAPVPPARPEPTPVSGYTVRAGDTLSAIAFRFGLQLAELEAMNPRAGHPAGNFDTIWPGDTLVVKMDSRPPAPIPVPTTVYVVQRGDNLSSIAMRHGMSLGELERLNPHAGHPAGNFNVIWPGDHLAVHA